MAGKRIVMAATLVFGFCFVLVSCRDGTGRECCEKTVRFSYSRTTPSNEEYYNYAVSIRSLKDLMSYWNGDQEASRLGLREKVRPLAKKYLDEVGWDCPDEVLGCLLQKTSFEIVATGDAGAEVECQMKVKSESPVVTDVLFRAFRDEIMCEIERENCSAAMKATMDKGCKVRELERSLRALKDKHVGANVTDNKQIAQKESVDALERDVVKAREEWRRAIAEYRREWDSVIRFHLDHPLR